MGKQSILKEMSPEYSLEGLMLMLKLQNFGLLIWRTDSLEKTLMLGKTEGRRCLDLRVMSKSLQPHGLQHTSLPCPLPTPGAHSNSCLLSQWCHPTISSSVIPFSSCLQSFPASGSFPMSQFFIPGGQRIGVLASAISPSNEYSGLISFRMGWLDLLAVQGTL